MTDKELADQRIRCNRAVKIEQQRVALKETLTALKDGDYVGFRIDGLLTDCSIPIEEVRDILTDRLIAYDKKLAEAFDSI